MAESPQQGRLLPSLLDRLTDDEPDKKTPDPRDQRGQTLAALRRSVQRDLAWLLNTGNLGNTVDIEDHPLIAQSVLNYGVPDFTGQTSAGVDAAAIERSLRQAILDFEPRILRNSVKVRLYVDESQMNTNAMVFDIEGELWAEPVPIHIYLKSEVDLETGTVVVNDQSGRGSA